MAPLTLWFQVSSPQNCEGINSCCFKPPGLWYFLTAALKNEYSLQDCGTWHFVSGYRQLHPLQGVSTMGAAWGGDKQATLLLLLSNSLGSPPSVLSSSKNMNHNSYLLVWQSEKEEKTLDLKKHNTSWISGRDREIILPWQGHNNERKPIM